MYNNNDLLKQLTLEEKTYVNSQVSLKSKNIMVGYLLAVFLGVFGAHRFYYGKTSSAIIMLVLGLFSLGIISAVWTFIDLFLIPDFQKKDEFYVERKEAQKILKEL